MNSALIYCLKALRKLYSKFFSKGSQRSKLAFENNPDIVSEKLMRLLSDDLPVMIARFGANELNALSNYIEINRTDKQILSYIKGEVSSWWWNNGVVECLCTNAGFFPQNISYVERFCELMLEDIKQIDILGSWLKSELLFEEELEGVIKVDLELLNPYFSKTTWTKALENKKVLVVHPFAETIERQYRKRELLFNDNLLPHFDLKTIKAVQSVASTPTGFKDWFEALDYMKAEIDKIDYDICLIGCGAYGFPLAAHVKRNGKKSFHLGGSLQLLFGIKGKRWENPNYNPVYNFSALMNEHWVYPDEKDKPKNADIVEGACYW